MDAVLAPLSLRLMRRGATRVVRLPVMAQIEHPNGVPDLRDRRVALQPGIALVSWVVQRRIPVGPGNGEQAPQILPPIEVEIDDVAGAPG